MVWAANLTVSTVFMQVRRLTATHCRPYVQSPGVSGWDLLPGHGPELAVQAGLVATGDQDVVSAPTEQVLGVGPLGVQGVGGDDRIGDVEAIQQRPKSVDLIGFKVHGALSQDDSADLVDGGEQVH